MTPEQAIEFRENTNQHFIDSSPLTLTVEVKTQEDVDQLFEWVAATNGVENDCTLTSKLVSITWNQVLIPKELAEALKVLERYYTGA